MVPRTGVETPDITGEAKGSYFESEIGVEGDPYIIANAKQLYYFNWLQGLDYFNKDLPDKDGNYDGKIDTVYFKLKNNIYASDYLLIAEATNEWGKTGSNGASVTVTFSEQDWDEAKTYCGLTSSIAYK